MKEVKAIQEELSRSQGRLLAQGTGVLRAQFFRVLDCLEWVLRVFEDGNSTTPTPHLPHKCNLFQSSTLAAKEFSHVQMEFLLTLQKKKEVQRKKKPQPTPN